MTNATATKSKTETETETAELGPRVRGWVLPQGLDLPASIAEANEAALKAALDLQAAEAEQAEAARQARGAAQHDQLAAKAAIEAGEPVPEPTEPAKVKRAEDARPRVVAAGRIRKQKARALREAIRSDESYLADQSAVHDAAHQQVAEALAALPEHWHRLLEARATYEPARRVVEESWSGPVYEPGLSRERQEQRIAKALTATRARGGRDLPEVEELIAGLIYHLERAT